MSGGIRPSAPNHTVLAVEDDPDDALLVRLGAVRVDPSLEIRPVCGGVYAIDHLEGKDPCSDRGAHRSPDPVILDCPMPVVDGPGAFSISATRSGPCASVTRCLR
jgi:CheY-like chemotaxis protein